jgi:CDP-diacylglycerol--serine O-phosphatidyltransferase
MRRYIPNAITCLNLFSGCMAVVFAFHNQLTYASGMVALAAGFDFADGMVARILKAPSEIGKQLDSLADMVSFGVVPGVIMMQLLSVTEATPAAGSTLPIPAIAYMGFLISIFSALRLAKFNIDTRQTTSFIGMPTPACTILVASLPLILADDTFGLTELLRNQYLLLGLTVLLSYLLVAELPLFALKFKNLSWRDNSIRFIFIGISAVLGLLLQQAAIPIIILLYILLSVYANRKPQTA